MGRDLGGRGHEAYPEAALLLDINDDVASLDLQEGVLADVVNVSDDVPGVDHTVHAPIDNVEGRHTLQCVQGKIISSWSKLKILTRKHVDDV